MSTTLKLNDKLLEEARVIGQHRTKRAAVRAALEAYIKHHRQVEIIELFGQVHPDSEQKAGRARRRH